MADEIFPRQGGPKQRSAAAQMGECADFHQTAGACDTRHLDHLPDRLDTERLTLDELKEAARLEGYGDLAEIDYAVLETDGKLSFIPARNK
jgi:hypothetical protein